jgi:hypothetical protein
MVGKAKAHTKADQRRFDQIQQIGCVPCLLRGLGHNPPDIHHIIDGGRRRGHSFTYGNCPYHHRGIVPFGHDEKKVKEIMGPSLAKNPKEYHEVFGSEEYLLEVQNMLIEKAFGD